MNLILILQKDQLKPKANLFVCY